MNNKPLLIAILLIVVLTVSCTKKPEASLTLNKSTVSVNEIVTATSTSSNSNTFRWTVYDGTNTDVASSSQFTVVSGGGYCDNTMQFKITTAGTYTVYLRACNYKDGCNATETSGYCDTATALLTVQ